MGLLLSGALPGTEGLRPPSTIGPIARERVAAVGSPSTLMGSELFPRNRSLPSMIKDFAARTWRIAVTVGPLVAIALSLVAGLKWR